jgi:hypothetical protein
MGWQLRTMAKRFFDLGPIRLLLKVLFYTLFTGQRTQLAFCNTVQIINDHLVQKVMLFCGIMKIIVC